MVGNGSYIEFKNEEIGNIASTTRTSQGEWDDLWESTKAQLGSVVSEALDALTGSSLEDRSLRYHQKSQQYTSDINLQHVAMTNIGNISSETNTSMARTIAG
jgi:preprotein translocase subunit SecD